MVEIAAYLTLLSGAYDVVVVVCACVCAWRIKRGNKLIDSN